jgi:hypothetical protein
MTLGTVRRRAALLAVGTMVVAVGAVVAATPAYAAVVCQVTYAQTWGNNGGGFGGNITIRNAGTGSADAINGWTLRFAFPASQRVSQGWSGSWSQSGANVTVTNASWNGNLAAGASTTIGFDGSGSGANAAANTPASFSINNVPCNGQQPSQQALVVSPTAVAVPEGGTGT